MLAQGSSSRTHTTLAHGSSSCFHSPFRFLFLLCFGDLASEHRNRGRVLDKVILTSFALKKSHLGPLSSFGLKLFMNLPDLFGNPGEMTKAQS